MVIDAEFPLISVTVRTTFLSESSRNAWVIVGIETVGVSPSPKFHM